MTIPTQEHIDTCRESRDKLKANRHEYKNKIYSFVFSSNIGATCDEIETALSMRHQTASCFIRVLTKEGYLYETSERRRTRSGRSAIVWKTKRPDDSQMRFA